jgi:ribosomal protein S18 acetylase RimI-like enzyme
MRVRPLTAADEAAWRPLWRGYLEFYKSTLPEEVTADAWQRVLEGDPQFGLAAEDGGELIGFAHCLLHPSTWSMTGYCYLEDLFVAPSARGKGAGRALIEAVFRIADEHGCDRVYWHTQESNAVARALYDRLASKSEFVQYRR